MDVGEALPGLLLNRAPDGTRGRICRGRAAGAQVVVTARRAPNMNAFAERFVRTIKDECLSKLIFFGEGMLQRALREFVAHYHAERNHQALDNTLIAPPDETMPTTGRVVRRERLGGLLSYYHRRRRTA